MEAYCSSSCFLLVSEMCFATLATTVPTPARANIANHIGHIDKKKVFIAILANQILPAKVTNHIPSNPIHPTRATIFPVLVVQASARKLRSSINFLTAGMTASPIFSQIAPNESLKAFH